MDDPNYKVVPTAQRPTGPANTPSALVVGGLLAAAAAAIAYLVRPTRPRVFVSYDHDHDVRYRDLLRAWDANARFQFTFDLASPVVRIESEDEAVVKRALTPKLKAAEVLLVIIGANTWRSRWIRWEIERALETDVDLPIAAVKIDRRFRSPASLKGVDAVWGYQFAEATVTEVLQEARQRKR
jgi:hypothetical protein